MNILLLNAGSSSLKFSLFESTDRSVRARGLADWSGAITGYEYCGPDGVKHTGAVSWKSQDKAVRQAVHDLMHLEPVALPDRSNLAAVGHRWVHGGDFTAAVRVTPEVRSRLATLADLAPLHNPPSLEALAAAEAELPDAHHVAVFDTAFHATLPPEARVYPVPYSWTQQWGLRRYGFHGLSYAYLDSATFFLRHDANCWEIPAYSSGGRWGNARLDAVHVDAQGFQSRLVRFRVGPPRLGIATLIVPLFG